MGDQQPRVALVRQALRQRQVVGAAGVARLRGADARHQRTHQRAIGAVVAQHRHAVVVAALGEPGIQEAEGQVAPAVRLEIHGEEGDVAAHVDPAQGGIEFEAVESGHLVAQHHRVGQVQVAVALAHPAGGLALFEQRPQPPRLVVEPAAQAAEDGRLDEAAQAVERGRGIGLDARHGTPRRLGTGRRNPFVERGQPGRQAIEVRRLERAGGQPLAQQRSGRELPHAQHVFDRFAGPLQTRRRDAAADRHHVAIERWRQPPVQAQLLVAVVPARLQGAEVEEAEAHRLLDLPRMLAVEQHPRDVRLDALHRAAGARLQEPAQGFDQRVGRVAGDGSRGRREWHGPAIIARLPAAAVRMSRCVPSFHPAPRRSREPVRC